MIVKIRPNGASFGGLTSYQMKEDEDQEIPHQMIGGNVVGHDPKLAAAMMKRVADERPDIKKPVMHMIVAWHPEDKVSNDQMDKVGQRLLKAAGMDIENHQYLMVRHNDCAHPHMHIAANRVGIDGNVFVGKFGGKKARKEADKIEVEMDFTPALSILKRMEIAGAFIPMKDGKVDRERFDDNLLRQLEFADEKQEIGIIKMQEREAVRSAKIAVSRGVKLALKNCDGTFESLDEHLEKDGIVMPIWSFNKQGEFNGASFALRSSTDPNEVQLSATGTPFVFKGSQLGPKPGLSRDVILEKLDNRRDHLDNLAQRQTDFRSYQMMKELRLARQPRNGGYHFSTGLGTRLMQLMEDTTSHKLDSNERRLSRKMSRGSGRQLLRIFDNKRKANIAGARQVNRPVTNAPVQRRRR